MVQNKKLIEELKKYNTALDKHFTNLDFDSIATLTQGKGIDSNNAEFYSLVATSIMDTKTEMALMRKNLSVEIEGMVARMIQQQQGAFFDQMSKFYGKVIFELKENLNSHVTEINSDVSELKRDIGEVSRRNKDFSKDLESFGEEIREFKQALGSLEELSLRNNNSKELVFKLNGFEEKFDKLLSEVSKKNNFIESNLVGVNKKLAQVETRVLDVDEILLNERTLIEKELIRSKLEFENIDSRFKEMENMSFKLENLFNVETQKLNKLEVSELEKDEMLLNQKALLEKEIKQKKSEIGISNKNKVKLSKLDDSLIEKSSIETKNFTDLKLKTVLKNETPNILETKSESKYVGEKITVPKSNISNKLDSKIQKILDIDKRLEKLESLR